MDINQFKDDVIDRLKMAYPEKSRKDIEDMLERHGTIEKFKNIIEDT